MAIINIDDPEYVKLYREVDDGLVLRCYHSLLKYRYVIPFLKLVPTDASVLDVGCARGRFLLDLKRYGYTRLYGLDLACGDTMLKPGEDAIFFQGSIADPCFKLVAESVFDGAVGGKGNVDFSFDAVFVQNMLHHIPVESLSTVAANLASICNSGGHLFVYDVTLDSLAGKVFHNGILRLFPKLFKAAYAEREEQAAFCKAWPAFHSALEANGMRCLSRSEWSFYRALTYRKS